LRGEEPVLDQQRFDIARNRIFADLTRSEIDEVQFTSHQDVELPGIGTVRAPVLAESGGVRYIIGIHGPLTPDHSADPILQEAKEYGGAVPVFLIDEIIIARNLPEASRQVRMFIG
jgi:hypothetical protein